jgi:type IV pilus assembly protein PilA
MRHYSVNNNFNKILLLKLATSAQKGFTLIELLVVVIIVGILAAVATPNLIAQIGKSRETEATSNLGIISRSQQGYHFEKQTFADTMVKLNSNVSLNTTYYNFPDPSAASSHDSTKINILVQHEAVPIDADNKFVIKNYASGVYFDASSSNFNTIICQGQGLNQTVAVPTTTAGSCTNSGRRIK